MEKYGYDPLLVISPFQTLIQLICFLGGIPKCVTVAVKWIIDRNIPFALPITCYKMDYYFKNDDETK